MIAVLSAFAQSARIKDFNIRPTELGDKVLVTWTTNAGSTCPSLSVARSTDSIQYTKIYTYPSVCGNSDTEESYSWVDPEPEQATINYYRLNLDDVEFTKPLLFDNNSTASEKLKVFPNPFENILNIEIKNSENQTYSILLYSSSGKLKKRVDNLNGTTSILRCIGCQNDVYTLQVLFEDNTNYYKHLLIID